MVALQYLQIAVSIHPFGEVATARYTVLSNGVTVTTFPGPTPGQSIVFPGEVAVSVIVVPLQISVAEPDAVTIGFANMVTTTG